MGLTLWKKLSSVLDLSPLMKPVAGHETEVLKQQLTAPCLLKDKELTLSWASPYGLGAVLSQPARMGQRNQWHLLPARSIQPRRNTPKKEGLAIVFGVKKFNQYLLGRSFYLLRSQTTAASLFRISTCTSDGFSQNSEMGTNTWSV